MHKAITKAVNYKHRKVQNTIISQTYRNQDDCQLQQVQTKVQS